MTKPIVPVFYACDDNFIRYTIVSLTSLMQNASREYQYHIYILHTGVSEKMKKLVLALGNANFSISFEDVTEYMHSISEKIPLRDYYSKTTYYRFFIAEMFHNIDKAIYMDSDTIIQGDISKLYEIELGDAYLGACHEQVMVQVDEYGTYVERVVGVCRHEFFNAGVLLLNCEQLRAHFVLDKFIQYLHAYNFVVTQDEDYLNLICKDHVHWIDQRWNTPMFGQMPFPDEEAYVLHYIMTSKPWHYRDCRSGDVFWKYAKMTAVYEELCSILDAYTDELRERDRISCENLMQQAIRETNREDNFLNRQNRSPDRVAILKKIEAYEAEGRFDEDVEQDPPTKPLLPDEIDYLRRKPHQKLQTKMAFAMARRFLNRILDQRKMIVKEIRGIEHFQSLNSGAVITCNHFNAFDSFAIQMAYEASEQKKRGFFRVIREGNYTSFPGFYGFLMRHCNTLPLSSNHATMRKFVEATNQLLKAGHFVLFYPEQSMWWNYRKPKPLKGGAYTFAAKNNVPVLPCFITMKDSEVMGEDGFFVQEYTIHIGKPIYPDAELPYGRRVAAMMDANAQTWKEIYEDTYGIPLQYRTKI